MRIHPVFKESSKYFPIIPMKYNQGHLTWVTLLKYLSVFLPLLFCNGFSVELYNFQANIERGREKEVLHNMLEILKRCKTTWVNCIIRSH